MTVIGVIATVALGTAFFGFLWILVGTGLLPGWILIAPIVIVGLVAAGFINKVIAERK